MFRVVDKGQKYAGLGGMISSLLQIPGQMQAGRSAAMEAADVRRARGADINHTMAQTNKINQEMNAAKRQQDIRGSLGDAFSTVESYTSGQPMLANGDAGKFISQLIDPTVNDYGNALSQINQGYEGNPQQIGQLMETLQGNRLREDAAGMIDQDGTIGAMLLGSLANKTATPQIFRSNASGGVVNSLDGSLDESGDLISSVIGKNDAAAQKSRADATTAKGPESLPTELRALMQTPARDEDGGVMTDPTSGRMITSYSPELLENYTGFMSQGGGAALEPHARANAWLQQLSPELRDLMNRGDLPDNTVTQPGMISGLFGGDVSVEDGAVFTTSEGERVSGADINYTATSNNMTVREVLDALGIKGE